VTGAEQASRYWLAHERLDLALEAVADFVDVKSPWTIGHSRGVAALATDADNLFVLLSAKGLNPRIHVATRAAEEGAVPARAGHDTRRLSVLTCLRGPRSHKSLRRLFVRLQITPLRC